MSQGRENERREEGGWILSRRVILRSEGRELGGHLFTYLFILFN